MKINVIASKGVQNNCFNRKWNSLFPEQKSIYYEIENDSILNSVLALSKTAKRGCEFSLYSEFSDKELWSFDYYRIRLGKMAKLTETDDDINTIRCENLPLNDFGGWDRVRMGGNYVGNKNILGKNELALLSEGSDEIVLSINSKNVFYNIDKNLKFIPIRTYKKVYKNNRKSRDAIFEDVKNLIINNDRLKNSIPLFSIDDIPTFSIVEGDTVAYLLSTDKLFVPMVSNQICVYYLNTVQDSNVHFFRSRDPIAFNNGSAWIFSKFGLKQLPKNILKTIRMYPLFYPEHYLFNNYIEKITKLAALIKEANPLNKIFC